MQIQRYIDTSATEQDKTHFPLPISSGSHPPVQVRSFVCWSVPMCELIGAEAFKVSIEAANSLTATPGAPDAPSPRPGSPVTWPMPGVKISAGSSQFSPLE